jgi:hypothetical protein
MMRSYFLPIAADWAGQACLVAVSLAGAVCRASRGGVIESAPHDTVSAVSPSAAFMSLIR